MEKIWKIESAEEAVAIDIYSAKDLNGPKDRENYDRQICKNWICKRWIHIHMFTISRR